MHRLPRNERRKDPRPLGVVAAPASKRLLVPRGGRSADAASPTPTPPPVAVSLAPRAENRRVLHAEAHPVAHARPPVEARSGKAFVLLLALTGLVMTLVVRSALAGDPRVAISSIARLAPYTQAVARLMVDPPAEPALAAAPLPEQRADRALRHDGYTSIQGGVLYTPSTLASPDGAFDLLLHFHGNVKVVVESVEVAKVNAAVAVVNLGVGSAPYQDAYAVPTTYETLLEEIRRGVESRGLANAHIRRIALSSWSAGYGALSTIFEVRKGKEPLDAVLVLDGIHCGFTGEHATDLNALQLAPFVNVARRAAEGELMFTITHSEIDPLAYASSTATASYLLEQVGGVRVVAPESRAPKHLELESAKGAVSKKLEKHMVPTTEAHIGDLHVRGYRGETPEHHMAHLLQMGATVLPELAARWSPSR